MFALIMPSADTVCMNIFLRKLSEAYPDNYIFLVMDNAGWHHSKTLEVPENIELYSLLPYTPELNPIEQIWEDVREKGFHNEVFITLSKVIDRLCDVTLKLMNNKQRVASITHRGWLMNALMF